MELTNKLGRVGPRLGRTELPNIGSKKNFIVSFLGERGGVARVGVYNHAQNKKTKTNVWNPYVNVLV